MGTKKVNAEQIDKLFEFIEQKGVKFYDLQVELVDHFASAIESNWAEDPGKDFTVMMAEIYRNFKDYEFKRLIRQKMRVLNRRSWRIAWNFCCSFLTWPKVALTGLGVVTMHELIVFTQLGSGIFRWFALVLFIMVIAFGIYLFRNRPREKKFLAYNQTILLLLAWFNLVGLLFVQLPDWLNFENSSLSDWQIWAASGFMVFILLIFTGFFFYSRIDMHRELEKLFPNYVQ